MNESRAPKWEGLDLMARELEWREVIRLCLSAKCISHATRICRLHTHRDFRRGRSIGRTVQCKLRGFPYRVHCHATNALHVHQPTRAVIARSYSKRMPPGLEWIRDLVSTLSGEVTGSS